MLEFLPILLLDAGGGAAVTSPVCRSPAAASSVDDIDVPVNPKGWVDPTNIFANDDAYAVAAMVFVSHGGSEKLLVSDFGFPTFPVGATLAGIEVKVVCKDSVHDNSQFTFVRLRHDGAHVGDDKAATPVSFPATKQTVTFGGASDDWNAGLTLDDVQDASFGAGIIAGMTSNGDGTAEIDHVEICVYFSEAAPITVTLSGTVEPSALESEIVAGGETIILTLSGDTWVAAGVDFDTARQPIIDGLTASASPANGFNNEVKGAIPVSNVIRTSDTVVTITLPAVAAYAISANETVEATVPASALVTSEDAIVAEPTFTIVNEEDPEPPADAAVRRWQHRRNESYRRRTMNRPIPGRTI